MTTGPGAAKATSAEAVGATRDLRAAAMPPDEPSADRVEEDRLEVPGRELFREEEPWEDVFFLEDLEGDEITSPWLWTDPLS